MPQDSSPQLLRVLGLREGIAIHMGVIIGSAIFLVPATIAGRMHALGPILLVWVVAGLLTLFGALTLAELGAVLPEAGGPYVYLQHSFGRPWAFLFSWNDFFINKAGSIAAISVGFTTYLGHFVPALSPEHTFYTHAFTLFGRSLTFTLGWNQLVAMAVIAAVTAINVRGVTLGGRVMTALTFAKVAALLGLIAAAWLSHRGDVAHLRPFWPAQWTGETTAAFGVAMISALWAYDGWSDVTLTAGELRHPQRDVPRSLLIGTFAVIALYLAANLAYAWIIPLPDMARSPRIAADVAQAVLGPIGASLIIAGILCSTFGSMFGLVLAGPRAIYAGGVGGTFPGVFGKVHPRFRTPHVAILTLGVWGALLTLSGTYDQITSYVVFGSWGFYALTALSVIVLRRKLPHTPRPYRAWGYPYATLLFVAIAGWFIVNTWREDPRNAAIGVALLLVSLPFYASWTRGRSEGRSW